MIENRNLTTGTRLTARYHKQTFACEVTEKEGKLFFKLEDGREFKSLSAAGTAITGGACNGWAFWSLQAAQDAKPAEIPAQDASMPVIVTPQPTEATATSEQAGIQSEPVTPTRTASSAPTGDAATTETKPDDVHKSGTYRMKNQKGSPEGMVRWFCYECAEPFMAPKTEKHAACPKEHKQ